MKTALCPVHLFRSSSFAPAGNTVVSVAPSERVVAVYGDGGAFGERGVASSFGGAVVFRNEASGEYFIGVWGARNASRFRRDLRARTEIAIVREAPDARLVYWGTVATQ